MRAKRAAKSEKKSRKKGKKVEGNKKEANKKEHCLSASRVFDSAPLYQGIPIGGYTKMVDKILEGIEIRLGVDYFSNKKEFDKIASKVIYTGPIDRYYDYKFGNLEYHSVRFENEVLDLSNFQGNAAVNYTDIEIPCTCIIEHKWFQFGKDDNGNDSPKTVISREYSSEWKLGDEPYYPVNDSKNNTLYEKYRKLSEAEEKTIFWGRLGE